MWARIRGSGFGFGLAAASRRRLGPGLAARGPPRTASGSPSSPAPPHGAALTGDDRPGEQQQHLQQPLRRPLRLRRRREALRRRSEAAAAAAADRSGAGGRRREGAVPTGALSVFLPPLLAGDETSVSQDDSDNSVSESLDDCDYSVAEISRSFCSQRELCEQLNINHMIQRIFLITLDNSECWSRSPAAEGWYLAGERHCEGQRVGSWEGNITLPSGSAAPRHSLCPSG